MKKLLALLLAMTLLLSLAACTMPGEETATTPGSSDTQTDDAGNSEDTAAKPDEDVDLSSLTIGLANINERGVFGMLVKTGFEEACAARGWTLEYADNNSDGQTAVSNAEALALKGVDFVVDLNVDQSVGQTIMDIFNNAGIPVLAVDIALPGAPFFGIDSAEMGYFNGEFAADYIKENWDGELDYVLLITRQRGRPGQRRHQVQGSRGGRRRKRHRRGSGPCQRFPHRPSRRHQDRHFHHQ